MSYYCNGAGQRFLLPERSLEPPEDWWDEEPYEEEYDRAEDEMSGRRRHET